MSFVRGLAALLALTGAMFGQITGELKGVVLDGSGSAVTNAKVTLKSIETTETRTATTDGTGLFSFNLLKVGPYEVRAEAAGFRVATTSAEVRTGESASITFRLEVGQVTETVTVSDAVARIDAENAQLQRAIVGGDVQEIPVARNANIFALTLPGVAPVTANNPFLGSGSFNSNGGRGRGNNITIDGITATDVSVTGTGGVTTPLIFNTIREVKVITNNFSAEYGRNSSSQVLYITKSGTNEFHGEAFEYFQNDKLNARPFFDTSGRTNIVRNNEYGFILGGPVWIPKVVDLRNKMFWSFAYEGNKRRGAGATRIARVPTPAQAASITDPTSRALFQQYQLPTDPSGQITTSAAEVTDTWKWNLRVDLNLTSRDTLWFRYNPSDSISQSTGLTFIGSNLPGFGASSTNKPRQATAAHTHLFGNSAVNEFRFGFGQSLPAFPIDSPYPLGPRITIQSGEVNNFGQWEGLPQGREQRTYQFTNNFSFQKGRHNVKVGGEYYYLEADSFFDSLIRPFIAFPNFADFAAGRPVSVQQRFGNSVRANRVKNFFAFAQDDWKVTRNLTLNLGVRMEWAGGPTESNGIISNLNLNNQTAFGAAGSGAFGLLETGQPAFNSNQNWGPRVGFAYSPNQKTVVRGGYGVAYDFVFLNPITNQRFLPPFMPTGVLTGAANFTGDNSYANFVAGTALLQRETASQVGALSTTALNFGAVSPAIAQNLRNAQVQSWNLGVQREIFANIVLKASYVGTKGNFLPRTRDINLIANPAAPATSLADETARLSQFQAAFAAQNGGLTARSNRIDPRYNGIGYVESSANSNFHSFQVEVERRFSTMFFNASYTFGKSIDDGSDVLGVLINDSANQQDPRNNRNNRAPSQFDLRQRFVVTYNWQMPWGKQSPNWFVKSILSGWALGGITSIRSGFPVTLDAGPRRGLNPLTVIGGGAGVRPDYNSATPLTVDWRPAGSQGAPFGTANPEGVQTISTYATSLGLSQPYLGNFGNLGRNNLRLNGETNFDINLYKNFSVGENRYFQLRGEFYNAFNNTSFQDVDRVITSPSFGQYLTVGQNARYIQLAARFVF
jgi:hypothetical protein